MKQILATGWVSGELITKVLQTAFKVTLLLFFTLSFAFDAHLCLCWLTPTDVFLYPPQAGDWAYRLS